MACCHWALHCSLLRFRKQGWKSVAPLLPVCNTKMIPTYGWRPNGSVTNHRVHLNEPRLFPTINLASRPPSEHHTQFLYPVGRLEESTAEPQRVSTKGRGAANPKAHQLPRDTHSSLPCAQRSSWGISTAWKSPTEVLFSTVPDLLLQAPASSTWN